MGGLAIHGNGDAQYRRAVARLKRLGVHMRPLNVVTLRARNLSTTRARVVA